MSLRRRIEEEIRRGGPIPFSRYMELCLYEPELGFYSRAREVFGKAGDFYTASDVHAVFGRLLARQFEEMWRTMGSPDRLEVVELGPGRGLFALDVLDWAGKKWPEFFAALHYRLVESSPHLRSRLAVVMNSYLSTGKVSISGELDSGLRHAIIFANEFFDALPVDIVDRRGQVRVTAGGERFQEDFAPPRPELLDYLDRYSVHPQEHERVEVCLPAMRWMERIATSFERGFVITVDYGFTRGEQLAGRHLDTLMTYREHTSSPDPYQSPGEQDITAHVNFTALRAAGEQAGLDHLALLTQSQFLLGIGEKTEFSDAFEECKLPQEHTKRALQLKHLVTPAGMGETFHVLVMSRGVDKEKAAPLGGLSFAR